ncbi:DUF2863 family protein [Massilia arenosa]|uniref:DUF2863 family protein n=1 Tax=Zemynaea arenosa TaxID=2561931 RepID=A0A4Y9SFW3_9BURK|nr:DUF2863 family protein [Massilia arenosa]TFW19873.1 DUF2863 family protein [Massilia arenosa]
MAKHKHHPPVSAPRQDAPTDHEADAQELADLALATARRKATQEELARAVRRRLLDRHDDVLYDALELARGMADRTFGLLRETIEEHSATVLLRREGAPDMEINAFAIPVFVRSTGGLTAGQAFQDQAAYAQVLDSLTKAGLESPKAKVVLVQHWYDLAEFDRITYSRLHEIVREAGAAMTDKKLRPVPLLERSMSGWAPAGFEAGDAAVELRFLLGFALKRADDPFYAVPKDEALADVYFEQRMASYRAWTQSIAPQVARLLAPEGAGLELNFLYQDLFYGAKAQALSELFVLQLLSDVNGACEEAGIEPASARASVRLVDDEGDAILLVEVDGPNAQRLATAEKILEPDADVAADIADLEDALATLGLSFSNP